MKKVYTSHSKHNFYPKKIVSAYVLEKDLMPLNPFMNWDYFLDDLVERDIVRNANGELLKMSDELWQFGEISDGCYQEIMTALDRKMPIKFFTVGGKLEDIKPITDYEKLVFEKDVSKIE